MFSIKHILVPYDFSDFALRALKTATKIALHTDLEKLSALYVVDRSLSDDYQKLKTLPETFRARLAQTMQEALDQTFEKSRQSTQPLLFADAVYGKPAIEILFFADQKKADLIVIGSKGHRGLKRLWLGSVAEEVSRRSQVPVLVCREESKLPKRVLIPVDFSDFSHEALSYGVFWAKAFGAEIFLFHAIDLGDLALIAAKDPENEKISLEKKLLEQANLKLSELAAEFSSSKILPPSLGDPLENILQKVEQEKIDTVILGTHGRTGLKRILMGSVAEKVLRYSPCNVLTFRPQSLRSGFKVFEDDVEHENYMKNFR